VDGEIDGGAKETERPPYHVRRRRLVRRRRNLFGIMGAATPNIDRIAHDGVMLTDCYAQASCTAGRKANAERFGSPDPLAANKAVAPKE
jgi:hypothetical protein